MKTCLYGTCSDNVVGYCKYHHCYVTVKQMRTKECRQKQCVHLEKNENHPFWGQLERKKQKRKERKERLSNYTNKNINA